MYMYVNTTIILCGSIGNIQVPIGVILKKENKTYEMVEIMETLHGYVLTRQCSGEASNVEQTELLNILLGGDQLTAARARGAKRVMMNGSTKQKRLEGTYPVVEDWHAKMNNESA